jgi:L-alanine-DL-glutamate epimerase-like enolase superfamily enzyme
MLSEPVMIGADGMLGVPSEPGLGIALDEEAIAFHAVDRGVLRA